MIFSIVNTIDEKAKHKSSVINNLSQLIDEYLRDRFYGKDIEKYLIGLICVDKQFDNFFNVKKPIYVEHKIKKNRFTGEMIEMNKLFINNFKFEGNEYNEFINATDETAKKMLAKKILGTLSNLDSLPKKVKDFDKKQFKKDMETFFTEHGLI